MTHIVEHKSLRYTWELVRHTCLVDLEEEIEIRQVEISPSHEDRLLAPPYPLARFFEIEIDQIQKKGKTVYSFRNICPVEIRQKPDLHILNCRIKIGSSRVTRRIHSQEGDIETRWLYTDDFFLISLSSGDRHDLSMLLSLIIGKLNMIALSIQSGRRIRSEFENQLKYRAAMSSMFSEGVDGAFRDVPVYQQHGDVTGGGPDKSTGIESAASESIAAENVPSECAASESVPMDSIVPECASAESIAAENVPAESIPVVSAPGENAPAPPEIPAGSDSGTAPPGSKPASKLVIDLKPLEELQDLSWLSD
jgi:hypothetical protein